MGGLHTCRNPTSSPTCSTISLPVSQRGSLLAPQTPPFLPLSPVIKVVPSLLCTNRFEPLSAIEELPAPMNAPKSVDGISNPSATPLIPQLDPEGIEPAASRDNLATVLQRVDEVKGLVLVLIDLMKSNIVHQRGSNCTCQGACGDARGKEAFSSTVPTMGDGTRGNFDLPNRGGLTRSGREDHHFNPTKDNPRHKGKPENVPRCRDRQKNWASNFDYSNDDKARGRTSGSDLPEIDHEDSSTQPSIRPYKTSYNNKFSFRDNTGNIANKEQDLGSSCGTNKIYLTDVPKLSPGSVENQVSRRNCLSVIRSDILSAERSSIPGTNLDTITLYFEDKALVTQLMDFDSRTCLNNVTTTGRDKTHTGPITF
ncbi:hypothetical protein NDU88_005265 [Pleurodeles waltl]|uniref:Uncharacterized protein n=1 Tax=Pleurodeles waltl TaxID=8319 RepID=A0AAV7TB33_PLEWA|nr:hypothetical protein NDU88_005265 [Pleurodeles waltl]